MAKAEEYLSRVSIFALMKKDDLKRIAALAQEHFYRKGDVIIREGDKDGRLFVIVNGMVDVVKGLGSENEKRLATLGPYSYFGEMALIDDLVRSASVKANEETQLLSLDHLNLKKEIEKYPALAIELLQMLSRRIRAIEKTMINTLGNFLPICAYCKKIRDTDDSWVSVDTYISDHSETEFTHGICPACMKKHFSKPRENG
ncbi:MAG: cyclic nucleotide-binding domain-containing protein [Deltaproteobacteria bacterium]|nr:cyclic nucleotide-binding domain-containing protein [Deltaproteobacteria bacterium]